MKQLPESVAPYQRSDALMDGKIQIVKQLLAIFELVRQRTYGEYGLLSVNTRLRLHKASSPTMGAEIHGGMQVRLTQESLVFRRGAP